MPDKKPKRVEDFDYDEEKEEDSDDDLSSRKSRRQKVDDDEMTPEEEGFVEGVESADEYDKQS